MNDLTTEVKKLEIETLDNLKLSKAKNTIRAYKSDFNDFALFCTKRISAWGLSMRRIKLRLLRCCFL